jgi:hypothetical protein
MKRRKRATLIAMENRNALYNKTVHHNIELANKNTELSNKINFLENQYAIATKELLHLTRKRWWQFWKWFK